MQAMEEIAQNTLPDSMSYAWGGQSFQEKNAGSSSATAFAYGILMVFLIMAAQYEKLLLPFGVMLAVPFGLFGAFFAVWAMHMHNDVYFQIGLVTLVALAAKNAILIVEFASLKREEGLNAMDAALEAARLRFRPILMTSFAFILGVVPLVTSTGTGANSRHSIGVGVMGGMISATLLAVFFVPLFFVSLENLRDRLLARGPARKIRCAAYCYYRFAYPWPRASTWGPITKSRTSPYRKAGASPRPKPLPSPTPAGGNSSATRCWCA